MALTRGTATFTENQQAVTGVDLDAGSLTYFTAGTEISVGADPVIRCVEAASTTSATSFNLTEPWPHATGTYYFLASNTSEQLVSVVRDATALKDALQTATEGFGTAAAADVQTGPADATPGRLLANEAWGLGSENPPSVSDYNTLTRAGFYADGSLSTPNQPESRRHAVVVIPRSGSSFVQAAFPIDSGFSELKFKVRLTAAGTMYDWIDVHHTDNLIYAQNVSGSTVSSNGTVAGASLVPSKSGSWRNASGGSISNNAYGLWVRA